MAKKKKQTKEPRKPKLETPGLQEACALADKLKANQSDADHDENEDDGDEGGGSTREPKQADILIGLAGEAALFRIPDGRAYADITKDGHRETWPVRSDGFRRWLRYRFYETQKYAPNKEAIETATSHLEAAAQYDPKAVKRPIFTRVAAHEGKVYLDLVDDDWRVIEIDEHGRRLAEDAPVRFQRGPGMAALPMPVSGGSLAPLRKLLNIADEDFILVVAWLLAALRGVKPYPILALTGPPGSAKSTLVTLLRDIIDPNELAPGALPREVRDLVISGTKRFVMGYDNLSDVPGAISDALCRLSTGGGFSTRALYSDSEEVVFSDTRPIIIAGIEDVVGKPDLSERIIGLTLTEIAVRTRKLESAMLAEYAQARPAILGALLDIVAHGLQRLPHTTQADEKPRLADFAHWMAAAETARWPAGTFATAYAWNRATVAAMAVESEAVAQAVIALLQTTDEWSGPAKDLLDRLAQKANPETVKGRDWPRTPRGLGGKLRSATPMLRSAGIEVIPPHGDSHKARTWTIRKVPKAPDPRPRQTGDTTAPTAPQPPGWDFSWDSNGLGEGDWEAFDRATVPPIAPTAPETAAGAVGGATAPATASQQPPANPKKTRGKGEGAVGAVGSPTLSGRPPRAISGSAEDRREPDPGTVLAAVSVSEVVVPPPEAVCGLCGEAGILWPNPDDAAGWVHQGCYADQRQAKSNGARDHARGARP